MHPILFRIPLPSTPLALWWALAFAAVVCVGVAALTFRATRKPGLSTTEVANGKLVALAAAVGAPVLAVGAYLFRDVVYEAGSLPIFSYGVLLGAALILTWFSSARLATRAGLAGELAANCFLLTALFGLLGARLLYVLTNLDEFDSLAEMVNLRRGGYTAYGGLLGGLLGSWLALRKHVGAWRIWADAVAPGLAAGVLIARIGCYLFGCDFGKRLPESAPGWLQRLGTFPHWTGATQDAGEGSAPFLRQRDALRGTFEAGELLHRDASFPVHPTQLYEALLGLLLLALVLWQWKRRAAAGRAFSLAMFGYGVGRFVIEFWRDDLQRGEFGARWPLHIVLPCGLLAFAVAFAVYIAPALAKPARIVWATRLVAALPALALFLALRPAAFMPATELQLSVSHWLALATGLAAAYAYGRFGDGTKPESSPAVAPTDSLPA